MVEGSYAASVDRPLPIVRGGGVPEEVSPGTEVVANRGDALIFPLNEAARTAANVGTTRLVVLDAGIYSTVPPATPLPIPIPTGIQGESLGRLNEPDWAPVPPGPLIVTLRCLTLTPGTALPAVEVDERGQSCSASRLASWSGK